MDSLYVKDSMYTNYFLTDTKGNKVVNRALQYPDAFTTIFAEFSNNGVVFPTISFSHILPNNMGANHYSKKLADMLNNNMISGVWHIDETLNKLNNIGLLSLTKLGMVLEEFVELGGAVLIKGRIIHNNLKTRKYKNWRFLLDHLIKH